MSFNQKSTGPPGGSNTGNSNTASINSNNQTPQQVAKTLAGIQQQMQNLVHGQGALSQSTPSDLNAFFQQQRFQNMFKQQQQQLLQQHFQQQMQQQQKDRGGGGEPLALTRTPAAAELLNKTYQQHHQQQANGSPTASTLVSVNQQIQQQLQVFPPNLMQQLQAFQYQMQQQQQQQHPQQQQQQQQQVLQQAHQQSQSGQHQTSQHQQTAQQQTHGQNHQQQQQQQKAISSAAAHMQQLQQSLQQKYLSVAAGASSAASGTNKSATPTPPPLSNPTKTANISSNTTQLTSVSPITSVPGTSLVPGGNTKNTPMSSTPLLTSVSAGVKQVSASISLIPSKPVTTTSPSSLNSRQQKAGINTNKAMISPAPPNFQTALPKLPITVASPFNDEINSTTPINSKNFTSNSENVGLKLHHNDLLPVFSLSNQISTAKTENQLTKLAPSTSTSTALPIVSTNHTTAQTQIISPSKDHAQKQMNENEKKNTPAKILSSATDKSTELSTPKVIADVPPLKQNSEESKIEEEPQAMKSSNKVYKACHESGILKGATIIENSSSDGLISSEVSFPVDGINAHGSEEDTKEKKIIGNDQKASVTKISPSETDENVTTLSKRGSPEKLANKSILTDHEKNSISQLIRTDPAEAKCEKTGSIRKENDIKTSNTNDIQSLAETPLAGSRSVETIQLKEQESIVCSAAGVSKQIGVLVTESEEPDTNIKIFPEVNAEPVMENQNITNTVPGNLKDDDGGSSTKLKLQETVASLVETSTRKHGRQTRVSKALHSPTMIQKSESASKRSREEKRITKEKEGELPECPPTLSDAKISNDRKSQRHRLKTILYQSPLPELAYITKLSASEASNSPKPMSAEDKLIVFYRNEYMAVRNAEGTFYLCQTMQNVYRTSPRISIRWLSEDKKDSSIFIPDFYDHTDIECVLTTVELKRIDKNQLRLPKSEKTRIENILRKAIDVEKGLVPRPDITEENPDGLDISLYKDESQIEKKSAASSSGRKYRRNSGSAIKSVKPTRESKLKRGYSDGVISKPSVKRRRYSAKKKKNLKKNYSDDEDATTGEESDTEYRPNQRKSSSAAISKLHRTQRSPLAKARAVTPITATATTKTKTDIPHTSSPTLMSNNPTAKPIKGKSVTEISAESSTRKSLLGNSRKPTISKNKVAQILVEPKLTKKSNNSGNSVLLDNPSTSADAVAAGSLNIDGARSTRSRK